MHILSVKDIEKPLVQPHGETVYEMVGLLQEHGGAALHSLALITLQPGKSSRPHLHRHSEETYYILKGTPRMAVDGKEFHLSEGQACLIQPGETHQIFNDSNQVIEFLAVCAPAWSPDDSYYV